MEVVLQAEDGALKYSALLKLPGADTCRALPLEDGASQDGEDHDGDGGHDLA